MSLTLALAIVGALVLAALIAHSAWTARKAGVKRAELQPIAAGRAPRARSCRARVRAAAQRRPTLPATAEPRALRRRANARLDALIDAIAPLTLEAPVSAELALSHLPPTRRAGSKPFMIEGLNAENGEWEPITLGQRYGEFQAGVQLANRAGAINEIEYSEFVQKVEAFAEPVGAMADFPDMLDVVARARELDNFASAHDAQLAVHLKARGAAWSVGYIQQQASRHGFVPGVVPGRLVLPSAVEGAPRGADAELRLAGRAGRRPEPDRGARPDARVRRAADRAERRAVRRVASERAGAVARHGRRGRPTTTASRSTSRRSRRSTPSSARLYEALQSRDLAAGSPAARRLFS